MTRDVDINLDLETTALQILTIGELGTSDIVILIVQNIDIILIEYRPRRFSIPSCGYYPKFPPHMPVEVKKVWTISKTKEALTILCNGVEVLNLVYAEINKYCTRSWSKSSSMINFRSDDLTSDYIKSLSKGRRTSWNGVLYYFQ